MENKKKKVVIISIVFIVLGLCVTGGAYFFFGSKSYTFYQVEDIGEVKYVLLTLTEETKADIIRQEYVIDDMDVIEELQKKLNDIKVSPNYTTNQSTSGNGFSITFLGENKQRFGIYASEDRNNYLINIRMGDNEGVVNLGIKDLINQTSISKEDGERLYEYVNTILNENIHNIKISDIKELAEEKIYDWNQWRQYTYTIDRTAGIKTRGKFSEKEPAKFEIEGTDAYLLVWFYDGIIVDSEGTNQYTEVIDAIVYNENGEEMSVYEKEIFDFLEDM